MEIWHKRLPYILNVLLTSKKVTLTLTVTLFYFYKNCSMYFHKVMNNQTIAPRQGVSWNRNMLCYIFAYTKYSVLLQYSVQRQILYKILAWNQALFLLKVLSIFI